MSKYAGFSSVQLQRPQRSQFDLSHIKRSSTRMGRLTPVLCKECVPSDTWRGSSEILLRLAPLLAPIYDEISLYVHFFFVPNRLLWEDWEEFITGGRLGVGIDPVNAPVPPFVSIAELIDYDYAGESSLANYLGVPVFADLPTYGSSADYDNCTLDVMPFAAYQLIWYEYYRDRNFVADTDMFPLPSGEIDPTITNIYELRTRAYLHDYFTSALPFTQRGVEVLMPLAGQGSVTYLSTSQVYKADGSSAAPSLDPLRIGVPTTNLNVPSGSGNSVPGRIENIDEVNIDSSSVSINDFRSAYALQVWYERNAVGGSRYNESTLAHFGVRPQDERLQRPEYIGGGVIKVKISEIVSTAYSQNQDDDTVPLGNMSGHGITYGNTNQFRYFCAEHGFIMGIASIMNPPTYYQGLPRMFRRRTFLDYPWPTFAKLGEQRVDKAELYASGANLTEDSAGELPLFGYQSRYAEWKYEPNTNNGAFQSTLLFWTLARKFEDSPVLSQEFVEFDETTQERIFAVQGDADNFWMLIHNSLDVRRPLPYFGQPNTLGFS